MSPPDNGGALLERDLVVNALRVQIYSGQDGLAGVPKTLERVIAEDLWRDRIDTRTRERFTFDRFTEFIIAPPPAGLGVTPDLVQRLVQGTTAELPVAQALRGRHGGARPNGNNVKLDRRVRVTGSSRGYALTRLARERPDLLEQVEAGELSPHAAAIEAGWRQRTTSIPIDTAHGAVRALLRRFTADELRRALDDLAP